GRSPDQHHEGRLKGIVHVVAVVQNPSADAQHQRSVPAHEFAEGRLIVCGGETFEKLSVAVGLRFAPANEVAEPSQDRGEWLLRHVRGSAESPPLNLYCPAGRVQM